MDNQFTITINDDNGVRQFNLHRFVKKIVLYVVLFLVVATFGAIGTILYLKSNVDKIEKKRLDMEVAYAKLKLQHSKLNESMLDTQKKLILKKKELSEVSDSLQEIELMIGVSHASDIPLRKRVSRTKISSEVMAAMLQFIPNGSPVKYMGITSKFGYRIHPTLHTREFHRGTDLKARMNTPIYATADGIVEWAGYHKRSGYGNLIILQHNYGFRTYFGHLNKIVIKSTQFVKKGDLIGYSGNSGLSNGPHLHYEIRFISRSVNPYWFIKWNIKNYKEIFEKEKKIPWQSLITAISQIKILNPTQLRQ